MTIKGMQQRLKRFCLPVNTSGNVIIPLDNDGNPHYGAVQRHYRIFVKKWTTEELSLRYTEALSLLRDDSGKQDEEAKVTARWIRLMEQQNKVPVDSKRRWILAMLLGIPATSFGLVPVDDLLIERQEMTTSSKEPKKFLDIEEYAAFLRATWRSSWEQMNGTMAQNLLSDIHSRIQRIHQEILYAPAKEHKQMMHLLCYYHQLDARILGDLMCLADALDSMNKAYRSAKFLKSSELQALVLYRRGYIYFRNGYTKMACNDFDAAVRLLSHISRPLRGDILLASGQGHAFLTQTEKEKTDVLTFLDEAYKNMGEGEIDGGEHFMGFDEHTYMLDRASALTGSPIEKFRDTSEASDLITKLISPANSRRRQTALNRIEAKIYLDKGYPKIAAIHAIDALNTMSYAWNVVDMGHLYQRLRMSKYGDLQEVTDLGLILLKAQQPQMFS